MSDELINSYLGQYHLRAVIGRGGMATVYKAYQASLDRFVAIKMIVSRDPQFVARFKREARVIARLQHPNILAVYDHGEQDGLLYLVLQYIENGNTLTEMLGQPIPPVQALRLAGHVLDGLDYAHARGIIHRDIKPSNILMASPRWPMLADFGIAKLLDDSMMFTQPGMVMGTAAYMAPEMAFGRPADARTDIYAVGIVLYEMLTGRVPFDADTPVAMMHQHAYEAPPPPRSLNPDLPEAIEMVLLRALAKKPEERYQTAAEMSTALEMALSQQTQQPPQKRLTDLFRSGVRAFEIGDWERAIERLERLAKLDKTNEDVADLLAAARDAQARLPNQIDSLYQAGVTAFQQARWDEAVDVFSRLIKIDPAYKDAAMLLQAAQQARSPGSDLAVATSSLETKASAKNLPTPVAEAAIGTTSKQVVQAATPTRGIRSYFTAAIGQTSALLGGNRTAARLRCPHCEQEIRPEWRVCPYCSKPINQGSAEEALDSSIATPPLTPAPTSATNRRWMRWVVSIVAIALLGGTGWAWRGRSQTTMPVNSGMIVEIPTSPASDAPEATDTPRPTNTPQPTATPRPTDTPKPTNTPQPTNTPVPPTATLRPPDAVVSNAQQRLRSGPGQNYDNLGTYTQGTTLTITGKDETGSWLQVKVSDGQSGWMFAGDLQINLAMADIAVVAAPPTPTPPPTPRPKPLPTATPVPELPTATPAPEPATATPASEPPTPTPTRKPRPKPKPTPIP